MIKHHPKHITLLVVLVALLALLAGLVVRPTTPYAHADTALPSADTVFQAWNNAFLVQNGSTAYYTDQLKSIGTERAGTWIAGLDIQVAQDQYERTHSPADRQLVNNLVTTFLADDGTTWTSWDTWNDDIAWMDIATLRGYQDTGNTTWLNVAIDQWNQAYNRGWTSAGGGGIWEDMNSMYSKCSLSNNPMISIATSLYLITGDGSYLTKAEQIYAWVRANLVNTTTGVVNECIAFPNGPNGSTELQASDNAYNAGSFIEAANNLYRITGNSQYYDDAMRTADHFLNTVPIVANNAERGSSYQYWLFKGISDFCTDNDLCSKYDAYMLSNAAQAWSERNSADLTWNDWTNPTNDSNPDAFEMNGMVGLFEVLPTTAASPFSGEYELQSVASGMSLGVQGDSTANAAPIVQNTDNGDESSLWTFVPESNGYYEIKNARSGQLLNVSDASGALGALIVQWPAGGLQPGNDQWLPVQNADGTYSFYNRNSQLVLDDPAASTTAGTQYEQWAPNDTAGQKFNVLSRPSGASYDYIQNRNSGKVLDVTGWSTSAGTSIEQWDQGVGQANQEWNLIPTGDGYDYIQNRNSGMVLDVPGWSTSAGTSIEQWDQGVGQANQEWSLKPTGDGYYYIINRNSGMALDVTGWSTSDGTTIEQWTQGTGQANQEWSLVAV